MKRKRIKKTIKTYKMKETKEILELAVSLVESYKLATSDGKVGIGDVQYLVEPALKIPKAFDSLGEIPKEWMNMTEADIQEIVGYVKQVNDDPEFIKLIYHLIGVAGAVIDLAKK